MSAAAEAAGAGHGARPEGEIRARKVIEAILLVADEPVPASLVGEVLEAPRADVASMLAELAEDYAAADRGWVLREVAGGWRLYTSPDCAPWLERFVVRNPHGRLTGAALEVLAIICYRAPVARSEIAEIRGVDSDRVVRSLVQKGLIEESGRAAGPGTPALFSVSESFLERMGLRSVAELPELSGFMPDAEAVEEMEARLSPGA